VGTMAGSWSTASLALAPALFPKERFATFQSAMTLSLSFGMMVIVPACGWMLDQMNHDYIYIYYWGALMIAAALLATYAVYRRFLEQGGTKNYVAP
jgi:MFS family permease